MGRGELPALTALDIADAPELWQRLGFTVGEDATCVLGGVRLRLLGQEAGEGIVGWALDPLGALPASIDGIATTAGELRDGPAPSHPNGAAGLDHVVVHTPDLQRTLDALQSVGMELRRVREVTTDLHQAFLWAGDVLIEVAGAARPTGEGPARLWGLVVVAADLDAVAALPGSPLGSVRDAVQPGRRIATVRRELGSSVPLGFMTPHQRPAATEEST